MISQKSIEKRVQEELAKDERWKVIVRGNNWLCPYCGNIGARDLKMDEAIEAKIAHHLGRSCERWNYWNGEPLSIERLRQRAKLIVFKVRISRSIVEDRRFRLFTNTDGAGDARWLCPYCARESDVIPPDRDLEQAQGWDTPLEEDAFVDGVARHLLACPDFARGDDRLRAARELEERRARLTRARREQAIKDLYEREPSYRVVDSERRWICPFCALPTEVRLESEPNEPFFEAIEGHLVTCKARKVLDGKPRPVSELKAKLQTDSRADRFAKVKDKIQKHPIWRARDLEGLWYCPYCANGTIIRYPEKAKTLPEPEKSQLLDRFVGKVIDHLSGCASYGSGRDARIQSKTRMADVLARANESIAARRRVRQKLTGDELFAVTDEVGDWACPYCLRVQKKIHLYPLQESAVFEKTVEQVVAHFEQECEGWQPDSPPRATVLELRQAARGQPSLRSSGITDAKVVPRPKDGSAEWQRIKKDLEEVRSRVETTVRRRDQSLKEARSKQLRLLPEMPQIPGLEFGCVYRPCDTVGGDFYDIFRVDDVAWGVAIGDISGHGIEAALLMGLAKKLLEVHGRGRSSAAETLVLANADIFPDLDEKTFVTVFYGVLDTQTRSLKFSRAGHNPLILYNPERQPSLQVHDSKGMALGMDAGPIFQTSIEELEIELRPGDLVLQYTDGVIEAMNEQREEFGTARLHDIVRKYGRFEAEYVLWRIEKEIDAWLAGKPAQDDITMIAFKLES